MPSTPPRSERTSVAALSSVSDTPYKAKQATSAQTIYADGLDDYRDAVVEDVGSEVPQVTIQWFMDNIMPRLRSDLNVSAVVQKLEDNKTIVGGKWTEFSTAPAERPDDHEDDVFSSLETVAAAIDEAARSVSSNLSEPLKPTVVFKCRPRDTPMSKRRDNTSRPDGYGLYVDHRSHHGNRKRVLWETIVCPWEVKKRERAKDINDNIAKILWSFHHIMRDDPSRRFVVGFTIENTKMRLWFGSRTDALVTDSFDFTREHATLARFLLSLMYAEAHELGYDPTIQPAREGRKWLDQWDITVHCSEPGHNEDPADTSKLRAVTMRTERVEADFGAEAMRSRGTRVWSGRILKPDGKEGDKMVVLKDYWVEHDRLREATIRENILKDVKSDDERATLSKHLLTPMCSGDVIIAGEKDTTRSLRRGATVPTVKMYPTVHKEKSSVSAIDTIPSKGERSIPQGTGTLRPPLERVKAAVMLCDKSHHRIIFMEVAITIEKVLSVHDVLDAGSQAAKALQIMHKYGWVHRDISTGNILLVDGVVKISDLEYAKKMGDEASHNGRSGTALFMSMEALYHGYLFGPVSSHGTQALTQLTSALDGDVRTASKSTTPFRYNPLHDLESLWWVLVYLLLRRPTGIQDDTPDRYEKQLRHFDLAFTGDFVERLKMFNDDQFVEGIGMLHSRFEAVGKLLNGTRWNLLIQYRHVENQAAAQIDHKVGDALANFMVNDFKNAATNYYAGDADIKLCELRPPPEQKLTPKQPTAATTIETSLNSQASGSKKRSSEEEHGGPSQRRKLQVEGLVEEEEEESGTQGSQTSEEATQVQQVAGVSAKGNEEEDEEDEGKGKGKGKAKA